METSYSAHYSVLNKEVTQFLLAPFLDGTKGDPTFADLTLGGAGHTLALLSTYPRAQVIAVDQDLQSIENAQKKIKEHGCENRCQIIHTNFSNYKLWSGVVEKKFSGIVMDLGVSSHHFDTAERGFSFREDGPLDMRMDQNNSEQLTAEEILNTASEEDLANIIFKYGEERLSRKIAKNICEKRKTDPIKTTKELENIIFHSYPPAGRHGRTHPATRTFQALRIFVNQELEVLESTLKSLPSLCCPGARIAVISFHSLEDRIVKHTFKDFVAQGLGQTLSKKPILPSEIELNQNSRSRSAKLRIFEVS